MYFDPKTSMNLDRSRVLGSGNYGVGGFGAPGFVGFEASGGLFRSSGYVARRATAERRTSTVIRKAPNYTGRTGIRWRMYVRISRDRAARSHADQKNSKHPWAENHSESLNPKP